MLCWIILLKLQTSNQRCQNLVIKNQNNLIYSDFKIKTTIFWRFYNQNHLNNEVILNHFQYHLRDIFYNVQDFLLGNYLRNQKIHVYSVVIVIN